MLVFIDLFIMINTEEKETLRAHANIIGAIVGTADFVEVEKGTQKYVKLVVKGDSSVFISGEHGFGISGGPRMGCGVIEKF